MTLVTLLYLYIAFRIKHFMCDFIFQTDWMALSKVKPGKEGYRALVSHTTIHAIGTFLIMMVFVPSLWWLALVDFVVHSIIDRLKGIISYKKDLKPKDTMFWWAFGIDQELHNFTHLIYIVVIVQYLGGIIL